MTAEPKRVFVLGAGFTKAFLPHAPLLVDEYEIEPIQKQYQAFPTVAEILQREQDFSEDGKRINIERLLARLEGLPYDSEETLIHFGSVKRDVRRVFLKRIEQAKDKGLAFQEELINFAYYCLVHRVTCITFNYDDVLDETLHHVSQSICKDPALYWHPNTGYGFYVSPSADCIKDGMWSNNEESAILIHKLHGSINWRTKLGFSPPYPIDALVHHEKWKSFSKQQPAASIQFVELHLTEDMFLIPPVMTKTALEEPIIRRIWKQAHKALLEAEEVWFIGYSCPMTDLAASFLFSQALKGKRVVVVDRSGCDEDWKQTIRRNYKSIVPSIKPEQFYFNGAVEILKSLTNNIRGSSSASRGDAGGLPRPPSSS